MDYIKTDNGLRLLGQGQAVVLEVSTLDVDNHQVKIKHPDLGETPFIPYIQTAGIFKVPAVGDIVYVFCNEGFQNYPMAWGSKLHESAVKALLGTRDNKITVLYSTDGKNISHKIELDDGSNKGIRITTAGGNNINIKNTDDITITQINGNTITMNSGGIELKRAGSTVNLTPSAITVKSGTINLEADEINMKASGSTVKIDSTVNVKASDTLTTVDKVIISTHDQISGNAGFPTSLGPTKKGS